MAEDGYCKMHTGFEARIATMENNIKSLWAKLDRIQLTLFGIFAALVTNLIMTYFKVG